MIDKVKLIAMYLPQYHEIPENNEFWGKGFTDWTTVRSAKQYYKEIPQPKIPLNNNYYDLSKLESIKEQVELAKKYGIDGFCFYHYWFSSKTNLLQKPAELFLADKSMDISFCFCWDNEPWKRTWDSQGGNAWAPVMDAKLQKKGKTTLVEFDYEFEEGWENHFNYLLPFFKDDRYIKIDNKPVFLYYKYYEPKILQKMANYWQGLAKKNGFEGVCFISKYLDNVNDIVCDYSYLYQPHFAGWERSNIFLRVIDRIKFKIIPQRKPIKVNYEITWKRLIRQCKTFKDKKYFYGGFVNYDDSPRRGARGRCIDGQDVKTFSKYFQKLIDLSKKFGKKYIFVTAWNEWGEGAYLEPDEIDKFSYLEAVSKLER